MTAHRAPGVSGSRGRSADRALLLARLLNLASIAGIIAVLSGSLYLQLVVGEQPCGLCEIQRIGMYAVLIGPILNLTVGVRARHYALSILVAVVMASVSEFQLLIHVVPGSGNPQHEVLGLHLWTWALLVFALVILCSACMLLWPGQFQEEDSGVMAKPGPLRVASRVLFAVLLTYLMIMIVTVVRDCGLGICRYLGS